MRGRKLKIMSARRRYLGTSLKDVSFGGYFGLGFTANFMTGSGVEGHFTPGIKVNTGLRYGSKDKNGGFGLFTTMGINGNWIFGFNYVLLHH